MNDQFVTAYLGLGGNLGNPISLFDQVIIRLQNLECAFDVKESHRYESEPVDATGPNYVNSVIQLCWRGTAQKLLETCMHIESDLGRVRSTRNAPRPIDMDVLVFGNEVLKTESLTVPHPRMHLRRFVLEPLSELSPDLQIPGIGSVRELLPSTMDQMVRRI